MIQILAGEFGRRRLHTPKGTKTRPTTSQLRAAVFNICQNQIAQAKFLDICAGSGAMGLEAISRGASFATFIDHDRQAIIALRENIKTFGIEEKTQICSGDALLWLSKLKASYDIIYFDPPYSRPHQKNHFVLSVLQELDSGPLLRPGALLFLEESAYFNIEEVALTRLQLDSKRSFGDSFLYCLAKK